MQSVINLIGRTALMAVLASGGAFAIRPDQKPGDAGIKAQETPFRTGFKKLRRLARQDLLDQGEQLQRDRVALGGDAVTQVVRRLNARMLAAGGEVRVVGVQADNKGNRHIRLVQVHQGIPVIGTDMVVHVSSSDEVYAVGGNLAQDLAPTSAPGLNLAQIRGSAKSALALKDGSVEKQAPRLVIFDGALAYEVLIEEPGQPRALWKSYLDAATGAVLHRENRILHGAPVGGAAQTVTGSRLLGEDGTTVSIQGWRDDLNLYFLHNATAKWGVYDQDRFDWAQNTTGAWAASDRAAISLARNMELTQQYVSTVMERNSYDNAGAFANAYAHEGDSYVNAYWDGSGFHFGDGDGSTANALTVLDVAAHEYGHAITQYTSDLVYSYESGALNESYSDILGALVEFWAQPDGRTAYPSGTDGRADWMMGEDCWLDGEALRDLRNPNRFGQPSYYLGNLWYTGGGDNGGVHYNSGVQNFAFYLLSEGGAGSNDGHAYDIDGLGIEAAGEIAMYANMFLLTSTSQYADAREAWVLAASTLGYNTQTVRDVWTACGVLEQVNNLAVSPSQLAFGNVGTGASITANLTFTNNGALATTVTGMTFDNPAFSVAGVLPFGVPGGSSVQFAIRFTPPTLGAQSGQATITSNADDFPTLTVGLAGTGTAPAGISVTPASITASVAVGDTMAASLAITNTGVADLIVSPRGIENELGIRPSAGEQDVVFLRSGPYFSAFATALRALPNVRSLVEIDGQSATPTLAQLEAAQTVIVASNSPWLDRTAVGNVLADYVDAGGSLILMGSTFHLGGNWALAGRIMGADYAPLGAVSYSISSTSSATLADHAINEGVASITSGLYAQSLATQGGGIPLGTYTGGYLLGAVNPDKPVVSLNSFPEAGYNGGDLVLQVRNALDFTARGSWLKVADDGDARVIPQGATVQVPVLLDARNILGGQYTGSIELTHNAPGTANPLVVPVSFAVDGFRRLSASTSSFAFGNAWVGSVKTLTLTLTNTGDEATTIAAFGFDEPEFRLEGTAPTVIPGGQSVAVQVAFAPTDLGAETGTLTISSDAEDNPSIAISLSGAGTPEPQVSVTPASFAVSLVTGGSTTRQFEIENAGGDDLVWSLEGAGRTRSLAPRGATGPRDATTRDILAWVPYTDMTGEYLNVVAAIGAYSEPHTITNSITLDPAVLEQELAEREILIFLERELGQIPAGTGAAFNSVLQAFMDRGGVVIIHFPYGTDSEAFFREAGLMDLSFMTWSSTGPIVIDEPGHPLFAGVGSLTLQNATASVILNDASTALATWNNEVVVAERTVGRGRVIMMGLDFYEYTPEWARVISNAVNLAPNSAASWVTASEVSGILPPGGTASVTLTIDAAGMLGGTYLADLTMVHNAPATVNPLPIPVTLTVDGVRSLAIDPTSLSYGNVWAGTAATRTVTLSNTGSEATTVTAATSDNPEFHVLTALPVTVAPFQSVALEVVFAPTDAGSEDGVITITSDAEDFPLLGLVVSGQGTSPPVAALAPLSHTVNLAPSDAPADRTSTLVNSGGDVLRYQVLSITQTSSPMGAVPAPAVRAPAAPDLALIYAPGNYLQPHAPGEVIVAFKPGRTAFAGQSLLSTLVVRHARELAIARNPRTGMRTHAGRKLLLLRLDTQAGPSLVEAIARLKQDANVEYAEPNYIRKLVAVPNDAAFGQLYGMHNVGQSGGVVDADIDAPEAWDRHTGNKSLVLGVIDTGIDWLHPDLVANVWSNAAEASGTAGVDDDGNGYIDDVHGYDFINNDANPMDDHGHGTHCSGTIAGAGNNGIGVAGVSWTANLAGLKIFNSGGSTTDAAILNAVDYSNAMGMKITSNSWGGGPYSQSLFDLIAEGRDLGHLFIAAAGNNGSNTDSSPNYPSGYNLENIISVAATDRMDGLAGFSNYGLTSVDLGAPGVDTWSCAPGGGYQGMSGTSMATPHVSGAAYLVWSANNFLTAARVKEILLASTDPIPSLAGRTVTGGRLNVSSALSEAGPAWLTAAPMDPATLPPGASAPVTFTVNPAGLMAGAWTGVVTVGTNAPGQPEFPVAITANISGCRSLVLLPDALDFGTQFVGASSSRTLALRNDCNDAVTVSAASVDHADFAFLGTLPVTVPPSSTVEVQVRFAPASAGSVYGTLSLTTDADTQPVKTATLTGIGVTPPLVVVAPTSVSRSLVAGASTVVDLDIGNDGGFPFTWRMTGVDQGLRAQADYDASHFVTQVKGAVDARVGRPVTQASGGPDAFGYQWADSDEPNGPVFQWNDISSTGIPVVGGCDDCVTTRALTFGFPMYGGTFNQVNVTTNGWVNFGTPSAQYSNYPLPSASMPAYLVAGFFDDLTTSSGTIYFQDFGDRAVIQYQNVPRLSGDGTLTFQIVLHADGAIYLYYQNVTGNLLSGTTGIQDGTRATGLGIQYNTTYVRNGLAVRIAALPPWLRLSAVSGTVNPGSAQRLALTLDASQLEPGVYTQIMTLTHDNPLQAPIDVPVTLTVGETGLSRILRVGPSAQAAAAGSRHFFWNLTVGGETRGLTRGSRYTLYLK